MQKKETLKDGSQVQIRTLTLKDLDKLMKFYRAIPDKDRRYLRVDVLNRDVVAQRIKLTKELSRTDTGRTLYLLDEPTTGLHFDDVRKLLEVLSQLVELGNTVVIIEHNLEVIKFSDYIIDLGPEGGERGGRVVAAGTPEEASEVEASYTGRFLRDALVSAGLAHRSNTS